MGRFCFEAWWVLEESFEEEVRRICESTKGDLLRKLERQKIMLLKRAGMIINKRIGLKKKLKERL